MSNQHSCGTLERGQCEIQLYYILTIGYDVCVLQGITGHELCHYFWDPSVRMEWENTLETTQVMEWLSKDTHITYQSLKRIWPAAQRDSIFWSTIRHCPSDDDEGPDYWIVVNHSTDGTSPPVSHLFSRLLSFEPFHQSVLFIFVLSSIVFGPLLFSKQSIVFAFMEDVYCIDDLLVM